ncbi:hypothetical protein [Paraburkholderia sp. J94]|uniref:DUF7660 family protein n=1 Tax=Paraburkholderia sp. J94 TaxID=2805441 RepID=UPI002AB19E1E|nr:hypothetical protein [Paraburkholderia sp. J94]
MIDQKRVAAMKTREDFIEFMRIFVNSIRDGEPIENASTGAYLDGITSWVEDMDGYYENMGIADEVKLDAMNWRVVADILVAATMYE